MRFLVDAQLPPALARFLVDAGHDVEHVVDCGLVNASDADIWDYAMSAGAVIISKDEDFVLRRSLTHGPSILWIRRGNTTRRDLLQWFAPLLPEVLAGLAAGESVIEVV